MNFPRTAVTRDKKKRCMANPLILDELEKKSQEMLSLQHDLTNRISTGQQIIADFSLELKRLKEQIAAKEGIERVLSGDAATLQAALSEKRELIKNLIDDVAALRTMIEKKDDHVHQLKQKLVEKMAVATENEAKVADLKQEVLDARKEIIKLKNDISIFDSKFVEGDAQNKKLMADLAKTRDDLERGTTELNAVRAALAEQQQNTKSVIEKMHEEHEIATKRIMNESIRRNVALATQAKQLQKIVAGQRGIIELKEKKEAQLAQETVSRVKELLALKEISSESITPTMRGASPAWLRSDEVAEAYVEEEEDLLDSLRTLVGSGNYEESASIPQLDDLCPMIETAFDHGDSRDEIIRSLRSCGYTKSDIEEAFQKLGR